MAPKMNAYSVRTKLFRFYIDFNLIYKWLDYLDFYYFFTDTKNLNLHVSESSSLSADRSKLKTQQEE